MGRQGLTRRSLLFAAAAAGLTRSSGALAARPQPISRVFSLPLGDVARGEHTVRAPAPFDLVGVQWTAPDAPRVALSTPGPHGWRAWVSAGAHGHGTDVPLGGQRSGDPIWAPGTEVLKLRVHEPVRDVVLHFVDVDGASPPSLSASALVSATSSLLATPRLQAGAGQPPILARETWALGVSHPVRPAAYGDVRMAFVHHTANPNGYSADEVPPMLRAIFLYHRDVLHWNDIGYNFVVDSFGRIYEARAGGIDESVIGAQAGGYNPVSTGVAMLGDFSAERVSPAAARALCNLLAWKLSLHGVPVEGNVTVRVNPSGAQFSRYRAGAHVQLTRVAGHRQADTTDCPGDALYGELPALRRAAARLAGVPLKATLLGPAGTVAAPGPIELRGEIRRLGGAPVLDARVQIQARRSPGKFGGPLETTLAHVTTTADGEFAVSLAASTNVTLRVLHVQDARTPAAVSAALEVAVATGIILQASPAQVTLGRRVVVAGRTMPSKPRVRLAVVFEGPDGVERRLEERHLRVRDGAFSLHFTPTQEGTYRCVAETAADAENEVGLSPVAQFVVAPHASHLHGVTGPSGVSGPAGVTAPGAASGPGAVTGPPGATGPGAISGATGP